MSNQVILLCLCVFLFMQGSEQNRAWRGIVPLRSTRSDVERILGPPTKSGGSIYDLGNEGVFVEYSTGPCRKEREGGYNVPTGTVIQLSVSSSEKPQFSDIRIDESKYEKTVDPELPGVLYYTNKKDGIAYEVQNGKVTSTNYFPAAKDHHLSCAIVKAKQPCKN